MIKEYLDYIEKVRGLSPCTIEAYKTDLGIWVKYAIGRGLRWSTLTENDIDTWLASMNDQGVAARTRNRRLASLRGLLNWAQHKGLLEQNAARFCQSAKTDERLPQGLNVADIDRYLSNRQQTTRANVVALIVALMVESGLRIGEVLSLDCNQINLRARTIRVNGKGRRERLALFGERASKELAGIWVEGGGRLFPAWDARTYRQYIEQELSPFVGKMHPHQLRHTFATSALNAEMPITTLQMLMGHKRIETTQNYAKVAMATAISQYKSINI